MKHVVPHDLSTEDARRAADAAIAAYTQRFAEFNPTARWTNDKEAEIAFSAKGVTLKGVLELVHDGIAFTLDVPFVFKFIQKKAIKVIEEEVRRWVDKVRKGDI